MKKNKPDLFRGTFLSFGIFLSVTPLLATPTTEEDLKPFQPYLSGQIGISSSGQPGDRGGGQAMNCLSLTGTYNLTEAGDFISAGLQGGRQKLEDGNSDYGTLSLQGGLGLGSFFPSLSLQAQLGSSALTSFSGGLSGGLELSDNFSLGINLSAGLTNHQGPFPPFAAIVDISTKNWGGGLSATFLPWDFMGLTLSLQQSYNVTYQIQNLAHTVKLNLNQTVRTPSVTLTADFTIFKDFSLSLSGQRGQEFCPAGRLYVPSQGKVINFSEPTSEYFSGYSTSLSYNFQ